MIQFVIRGARGTLPKCGEPYRRYGGSTTCFSVEAEHGMLVIDAGTGISHVASDLVAEKHAEGITILFTHYHMDHLIGLPSFEPFYKQGSRIDLMGCPRRNFPWERALRSFIGKPFWPIGFDEFESVMNFRDLPETSLELYGMRISWCQVPHPQGCVSYRIEKDGRSVVFATDAEYQKDRLDRNFLSFCEGADVLVHDAQYRENEVESYRGWGHSTPGVAAAVARSAGVGKLILTHHAPARTDDQIDEMEAAAMNLFENTVAAHENMTVTVP